MDFGDGDVTDWSEFVPSGDIKYFKHVYSSQGNFEVKARAKDDKDLTSYWNSKNIEIIPVSSDSGDTSNNNAPARPVIIEEDTIGYVDSIYAFKVVTTDPDGDSVSLKIDFGDGSTSDWSQYISSGDTLIVVHSWQDTGVFYIKAIAKDSYGDTSYVSDSLKFEVVNRSLEEWIVYDDYWINTPWAIWKVKPDGSQISRVSPDDGYSYGAPAISPDGFKVAAYRAYNDGTQSLVVIDMYTTSISELVYIAGYRATEPRWNTTGDKIVFKLYPKDTTYVSRIYVYDFNLNSYTMVSDSGSHPEFNPANGRIYFTVGSASDSIRMYSMNSDGSDVQPVSLPIAAVMPRFFKDGYRAIMQTAAYPDQLVLVDLNTQTYEVLTSGDDVDAYSLSSDNSQIVFDCGSDNSSNQLYIINTDGSNLHILNPNLYGHYPSWYKFTR